LYTGIQRKNATVSLRSANTFGSKLSVALIDNNFDPIPTIYKYKIDYYCINVAIMCEFCSLPGANNTNRDAQHSDFVGFFSSDAIDAAIRQANFNRAAQQKESDDNDDDDGT
jgi:hypothetical protein